MADAADLPELHELIGAMPQSLADALLEGMQMGSPEPLRRWRARQAGKRTVKLGSLVQRQDPPVEDLRDATERGAAFLSHFGNDAPDAAELLARRRAHSGLGISRPASRDNK